MTSIVIPDSVTEIESGAFWGCKNLTSIIVEEGNPKYDSRNNCNAIIETATNTLVCGCSTTIIPDSVTTIEKNAFYGCKKLTSIVIPDSVTSIRDCTFMGCENLTSIEIGNSVTSIGDYAFSGCGSLTRIVVDEGNPKYDSRNNCNAIIETATNMLVCGCSTTIIPDSVTTIEKNAFYGCKNLTSIVIHDSITTIGFKAFYGCYALKNIYVSKGKVDYFKRLLPAELHDKIVENYKIIDGIVVIPHGVTMISEKAFYGCTEIKGINIPKSIKTICERSFYGCIGLTKIEIPEGITTIEKRVFYGCYNLKSIVLPDSITEIGEKAFYGCMALENIYVSKGKKDYFKRLLPAELHDKIVEK